MEIRHLLHFQIKLKKLLKIYITRDTNWPFLCILIQEMQILIFVRNETHVFYY